MLLSLKCCVGFCAVGFWSYAPSKLYLTSTMDKTHHGPVIAFLLCNFNSLFSFVGSMLVTSHFSLLLIDRHILAIQQIITHEEYLRYSFWSATIFWTASEALERNHGHKNRKWLHNLKVIFTKELLTKVNIFCCFDVCPVRPPQIFQVQAKILTVRPAFPDYLSVSYPCLGLSTHATSGPLLL